MSLTQPWIDAFQARAAALPGAGAPWLAQRRARALQRFADEGWPGARQDGWRHTSLATVSQSATQWLGQGGLDAPVGADGAAAAQDQARQLLGQLRTDDAPGHWLVFLDGRHAPTLSSVGPLPPGVRLASLADLLQDAPELLEADFGDETQGSPMAALNTAFAAHGAFLHLARGAALDAPVHLVFIASREGGVAMTRNLVVAEAGASATVVEHYLGDDAKAAFTNTVTLTRVARDANLTHLKLQQEGTQSLHLGTHVIAQEAGSSHASHSLSFGARLARHDISTHFQGRHCQTLLNGLYLVDGKRHVDHHTLIDHAHPDCVSHEYYRGVLDDAARGVFRGRILVALGADRTDAVQRSDSLLLSRLARADAQPELEIYADDVKCAHGATVGQIDENSLFYLRSRGLSAEQAHGVLVYAFAAQALARIETPALRQLATRAIAALLPSGELLGESA